MSARYERLVVLVSEARQRTDDNLALTGPLDDNDSEALSDLMGFAAVLSTDVEVYYIAGGDEELGQCIAAFISRHASPIADVEVLHDETLWERLLRHAGLNAYAAQSIFITAEAN